MGLVGCPVPRARRPSRTTPVVTIVRTTIARARVGTSIVRKCRIGHRSEKVWVRPEVFRRRPTALLTASLLSVSDRLQGTSQAGFRPSICGAGRCGVLYNVFYQGAARGCNDQSVYLPEVASRQASIKDRQRKHHHSSTPSPAGASPAHAVLPRSKSAFPDRPAV